MFDMLASKLGEAQAFADGLAVNLDVINMDRLLEEQEREEKSKAESLRLLRNTGDTTTDAPPGQASSEAGAAEAAGRAEMRDDRNRVSGGALGEIEIPQLRTDEEQGESKQERSLLFSPDGAASEGGGGLSNSFAAMEDGGGNFEDEFDPILASIRKPPQRQQPARTAAAAAAAATATANKSPPAAAVGGERKEDSDPSPVHDAGRPSAGSTFAAGFLSMLPGDMRAKAGEVMAQSSVRISESADAIRSALESGRVAAPAPADKFKRRQSDGGGGNPDLEDGRGGGKGGRRAAGGEGDDDEVRLLNVNELLSEEERQQLAAYSGGAGGGAGRFCGWRRLRKYIPVAVGIGLLGLFYLWRWGALLGDNANGVVALGSERV